MSSDAVRSQRACVPVLVLSTIAPMGLMTSVAPAQDDGPVQLGPITVTGVAESPYGPVEGYVANRTTTGAKTDTPLIEIPQSISVITRDRMEAQDVSTLNDALRYTPGVQPESFGNDSRVDFLRFRGFNDSGNSVFQDGLQLRSSAFGQFRPELYGAQRVEVLRGPASVLYGKGDPGGLVNIITKRPTLEPFGELEFEVGNFDHLEGKFDVGGPFAGTQSLFYRLTGLARNSDTQVDFVEDDRVFIAPALTWQPREDTTFTIVSHYQDDETGSTNQFLPAEGTVRPNPNGSISTDTFTGEPGFDGFDREVYSIGYLFEHRASDTWTFRQNARYNHLDVDAEQVFGGGLQADLRTLNRFAFTALAETDGFTIDTHAQAKFVTGPLAHTLLFGVDYQHYDFDETQGFAFASPIDIFDPDFGAPIPPLFTFLDTNTDQEQIGLYVQDQLKLYDKWVLTLGGRHDWVDTDTRNRLSGITTEQDDSEFSGRVGLVYLSDIGLAPYASYSESFLPTLGTNALGEPFEPETGDQYEFGIKYQPPGLNGHVTLAGFELTRQNVRTPDPDNPVNQVQTGEIRSRGIELEAVASLDFGLNLIAAYTYQDVEITESNAGDEGNRPTTVPEHIASLWGDYTLQEGTLRGLGFGAGVRYKGSSFGDAANTFKVDDFTLVDAAAFYDWKNLHFAINAENVFDDKHVAACSSAAACFFGPERTVVGSVRYHW